MATFITLGRVFLDSLAGYALARLRFPGRRLFFALILGVLAVPSVVLLIPRFLVLKELRLFNTYPGMILPIAVDAAGHLPDAPVLPAGPASDRGGGPDRRRRHLPHLLDGRAAAGPAGTDHADDPVVPGIVERVQLLPGRHVDPKYYTLTTGLANLAGGSLGSGNQYPLNMGAALLTTIPVAMLFFVFQRQFIGGKMGGSVKG